MSWQRGPVNFYLRHVERRFLARAGDPAAARRRFRWSARLAFPSPRGMRQHWDKADDVPVLRAHGRVTRDGLLLWFHGGAYVMGAPETHARLAAAIAIAAGCTAVLPRYRLAPEHPFPAAFDDARTVWDGLSASGWTPDRIVLGGDSAGGGLALALLGALLAEGIRPAGIIAFSPWADMTLSGPSMTANAAAEILLPPERIAEIRDFHMAGADLADPRASPVFADFPHPPPGLIAASTDEVLFDDARRMADRLEAAGGLVTRDWQPALAHVWPILRGWLPEADAAIARAGAWLAATLDQAVDSSR